MDDIPLVAGRWRELTEMAETECERGRRAGGSERWSEVHGPRMMKSQRCDEGPSMRVANSTTKVESLKFAEALEALLPGDPRASWPSQFGFDFAR
jgi:hypothetical protein